MTTIIEGTLRRSLNYSSFVDITGPDIELLRWTKQWVEFDGDLNADQKKQIWARMESSDDVDQANRAKLRAASAAGATNLAQMHLAYDLCDPVPDAVLPAPTTTTTVKTAATKTAAAVTSASKR